MTLVGVVHKSLHCKKKTLHWACGRPELALALSFSRGKEEDMRKAENTVIKCLKSQFLSATSDLFDLVKLFYLSISSAIE